MTVYSMLVVLVRIACAGPGLAGFMKGVTDRVAYTGGETVSTRNPGFPQMSIFCTDAALEEIW